MHVVGSTNYQALNLQDGHIVGSAFTVNPTIAGGHAYSLLATGPGAATGAGYLTIYDEFIGQYRMVINPTGHVGIGTSNPAFPLHMASGARVTVGGVWTDASSRTLKDQIAELPIEQAKDAFARLNPVTYVYKADPTERHAGFIAEDVPDLVATPDRQSLAPMDIVAVLTKVAQEQAATIVDLRARLARLEALVEQGLASERK